MLPIIKRIGDLRIDNDITQIEMAKILGMTRSKYSKIEIGILDFDLISLNKFANFFKINIDYIYGLCNKKDNKYGYDINYIDVGKI